MKKIRFIRWAAILFLSFVAIHREASAQLIKGVCNEEIVKDNAVIDFFDICDFSTIDTYETAIWKLCFKTYSTAVWVEYMRDSVVVEQSQWRMSATDLFDRYGEPVISYLVRDDEYAPVSAAVLFEGVKNDGTIEVDTLPLRLLWTPPVELSVNVIPEDNGGYQVILDVQCLTHHTDSVVGIVVKTENQWYDAVYSWYDWFPGNISPYFPAEPQFETVHVGMRNNLGWRLSNVVDMSDLYSSLSAIDIDDDALVQQGAVIYFPSRGEAMVYDVAGRCRLSVADATEIDLACLRKGIYIVCYVSKSGDKIVQRIAR